jgi:hypothetical protein
LVFAAGKYIGGSGFKVQGSKIVLNGPCRQYLPKIAKPDISFGLKLLFKRDKEKKLFL